VLAVGGGWLWLRDSSLVAVQQVTVTGLGGPDAAQVRAALESAAHGMTTLDVQVGRLRAAVAQFASVKNLEVSTSFPHGLRISVIGQLPVAVLTAGRQRATVAGDGTLLRDVAPPRGLPAISVAVLPGGSHVTDPHTLAVVAVLAAAPSQRLEHVGKAMDGAAHGVVIDLRSGPSLYFGESGLERAKWTAATDVLADPASRGAAYIDLADPRRPAAG